MIPDPTDLLVRLIACPSVTPADGGAQAVLAQALEAIGFTVYRFHDGEEPDGPIHNLFAIRGTGAPHLAFAGHTDVVPPGAGWSADPFTAAVDDGLIQGRGAVDMKGAIAAFVAAAEAARDAPGTVSLIITGDEEGPATFGTVAIMRWMADRGIQPDMILVGEPTSEARLGDTMKVGRRGSVNMEIEVPGAQGHVAYPHLARNPIPWLAKIIAALSEIELDRGTELFQPSHLEVTNIEVGNPAANVIPGRARARLNIRYNDCHLGAALIDRVRTMAKAECPDAVVTGRVSGEAFLTAPGPFSTLVAAAVAAVTGSAPTSSTSGGTSDARFLSRLAPTVELGLVNATMHKLDEAVSIADLRQLAAIYESIIRRALGGG